MFSDNDSLKEAFLSWKDSHPKYSSRNELVNIDSNIIAALKFPDGHIEPYFTTNLVVTTGAQYYAQLVGQVTPTNNFLRMVLTNGTISAIAAADNFSNLPTRDFNSGTGEKDIDGTYPKNNDDDVANPGRGEFVHTWRTSYLAADFDTDSGKANVTGGVITPATPTGTDPILNRWDFGTAFAKPATAALVVWVNHSFVGA